MGVKEKKKSSFPERLDREMMLQLTSAQFSAGFPHPSHLDSASSPGPVFPAGLQFIEEAADWSIPATYRTCNSGGLGLI